jgi:hypothetical protein
MSKYILAEIAKTIFGPNVTVEEVEKIRHTRHNLDVDG